MSEEWAADVPLATPDHGGKARSKPLARSGGGRYVPYPDTGLLGGAIFAADSRRVLADGISREREDVAIS